MTSATTGGVKVILDSLVVETFKATMVACRATTGVASNLPSANLMAATTRMALNRIWMVKSHLFSLRTEATTRLNFANTFNKAIVLTW